MPFTIRHKLLFCQLDLDILIAWTCTRFVNQPKTSHWIYYMSEEAKLNLLEVMVPVFHYVDIWPKKQIQPLTQLKDP